MLPCHLFCLPQCSSIIVGRNCRSCILSIVFISQLSAKGTLPFYTQIIGTVLSDNGMESSASPTLTLELPSSISSGPLTLSRHSNHSSAHLLPTAASQSCSWPSFICSTVLKGEVATRPSITVIVIHQPDAGGRKDEKQAQSLE
ncbi:hypothetical protein NQZ68_031343, partial [Dissostichus eleginoides]